MPVSLFSPIKVGAIECPNRVFMAPLTRCRAEAGTDAPQILNGLYYQQRAGAGLIISEATQVSPQGKGYEGTPGIYSPAQQKGWSGVTSAVHGAGGRIVAQLWHVGAVSHPDIQPGGLLPVSASDVNLGGSVHTAQGKRERVAPRPLTTLEIPGVVASFRQAALVAQRAGFDGVEVHSANGYLLEQFLRDSTNHRTDAYGGSVGNRIRIVLEIVDAVTEIFGRDRVGIRLSPVSPANNCPPDSNPQATYGGLVDALAERRIAFIHMVEGATGGERRLEGFDFLAAKQQFPGTYVANNQYTRELAIETLADGRADAVAFGRPYIANPDLARRLRLGAPLNELQSKTIYGPGAVGYTDYPFLDGADESVDRIAN